MEGGKRRIMKKHLLLVTEGFPFGESERPFLETEFRKLTQHFSVTVLAVTQDLFPVAYPLDQDVKAYRVNGEEAGKMKWRYLYVLGEKETAQEIKRACSGVPLRNKWDRAKVIFGYRTRAEVCMKAMEGIARKHGTDIIYTYWCKWATLAAARMKEKNPQLKVVTRLHGYDLYVERTGKILWQPFRKYITEQINRLIFVCGYGRDYYVDHWAGDCPEKCVVSYIGTRDHKRVPWEASESLSLISCSHVIKLKRVHLIIEGLALIPEEYQISWTHIGNGALLEDVRREAAEKLGNKPNITFRFTGPVPSGQVEEVYHRQAARLFITVSSTEGAPVSVEEALAMGIPAIGTRVGGIPDLIVDEGEKKSGYLLSSDPEPGEIRDTICSYMDLADREKKKMSDNARNQWEASLNAEKNAESLIHMIDSMR